MAKAVYCKCKNTYSISCDKDGKKCNADEYWKQGIGSIHKETDEQKQDIKCMNSYININQQV